MPRLHGIAALALLSAIAQPGHAGHRHPERYYQSAWCQQVGGEAEVILEDRIRIDCLTATHAVEVDFAPKWAESIGQALYYALKSGRNPGVLLILENPGDDRHLRRLQDVSSDLGITIWTVPAE